MKKCGLSILVISVFVIFYNSLFAITDEFKFMLDEIGVPQYNTKNMEINEDIYNVYNIFIYGGPLQVKTSEQRWKSFSTGKWCYGKSVYNGTGTRGEYAVLGFDYSSNIVYNYYFPLDRVTSTPIINWKFLNVVGALESWNNASKYYTKEQIDYMKNAKWWFQNIEGGKNDPYDQREYDLTALQVGLNKVRLETPATWKTKGSVYVERRTESGGIGWANFMIQPMSANARVESTLSSDKEITLSATEEQIIIPISFGADVKDMSTYAKESHIKDITSVLYYNDKEVARISGSKITSVGNKYMLVITRDKIPQNKTYLFNLKVRSYVKTEFSADGMLQDTKEMTVTLNVEPKIIVSIVQSTLYNLSKKDTEWVVSPLAQNNVTISENSLGLTESGRVLLIHNILDSNVVEFQDISNVELYLNSVKLENSNYEIFDVDKNHLTVKFKIPINISTTLYGWKSLRNKSQNFFRIDSNELLQRCSSPHKLVLKYTAYGNQYEQTWFFDTVDDYIANMNNNILDMLSITKYGNEIPLSDILGT